MDDKQVRKSLGAFELRELERAEKQARDGVHTENAMREQDERLVTELRANPVPNRAQRRWLKQRTRKRGSGYTKPKR